jgi:hypothetical protein
MAVGLLEVDGDRVMNTAGDAMLAQGLEDLVPAGDTDGVEVVDVPGIGGLVREEDAGEVAQELVVEAGVGTALGVPAGEVA